MQAKDKKNAENNFNWGYWCAFYGKPRKKYRNRAFEFWTKAAELGHVRAQFYLGTCYDFKIGKKRNLKLAKQWYEKAAKAGHDLAQYNLGFMYRDGIGVRKNLKKSFIILDNLGHPR